MAALPIHVIAYMNAEDDRDHAVKILLGLCDTAESIAGNAGRISGLIAKVTRQNEVMNALQAVAMTHTDGGDLEDQAQEARDTIAARRQAMEDKRNG